MVSIPLFSKCQFLWLPKYFFLQGADELELKNENHELRKLFTHFKVKKNVAQLHSFFK